MARFGGMDMPKANNKKGNPKLTIRLPSDHWIWNVEDGTERNEEVKKALDFYYKFEKELRELKEAVKELKGEGVAVSNNEKEKETEDIDERLAGSIDTFLKF